VHTRHDPHPLGNNDSFQGSVYASYVMTFSSPKVSDLSRHERGLVPAFYDRVGFVKPWVELGHTFLPLESSCQGIFWGSEFACRVSVGYPCCAR